MNKKLWIYTVAVAVASIAVYVYIFVHFGLLKGMLILCAGSLAIGVLYYAILAIIGEGKTIPQRIASGMAKYMTWGVKVLS